MQWGCTHLTKEVTFVYGKDWTNFVATQTNTSSQYDEFPENSLNARTENCCVKKKMALRYRGV